MTTKDVIGKRELDLFYITMTREMVELIGDVIPAMQLALKQQIPDIDGALIDDKVIVIKKKGELLLYGIDDKTRSQFNRLASPNAPKNDFNFVFSVGKGRASWGVADE